MIAGKNVITVSLIIFKFKSNRTIELIPLILFVLSCTCAGIKIKHPLLKECTRLFKYNSSQYFFVLNNIWREQKTDNCYKNSYTTGYKGVIERRKKKEKYPHWQNSHGYNCTSTKNGYFMFSTTVVTFNCVICPPKRFKDFTPIKW